LIGLQGRYQDLDDYIGENSDARASGALVTHRRRGASFRVVFDDAQKQHQQCS
jgi:hypothetical protein